MGEIAIGDFVRTIYGVSGKLEAIKFSPYGRTAFIRTADGRTFYCPFKSLRKNESSSWEEQAWKTRKN